MLVGMINQKKNTFYIYMKEDQEKTAVTIVLENGKIARLLNEEEAKYLLNTILVSKIEYKESKEGYDIYIDEAGNQRFYKDGKEDYLMFFYNNGISAIENEIKTNEDKNKTKEIAKRFKLVTGGIVLGLTLSVFGIEAYQKQNTSESSTIEYAQDNFLNEKAEHEKVNVDLNECKELIYNSEYLSDDEKNILYNEDLFTDVLAIADNSRNFNLREKLNNININIFSLEDEPWHNGYYNRLKPNEINLADYLESDYESYKNVLIHEYIHLLQFNNEYSYIQEACAEIIKDEYFDVKIANYYDKVYNVKFLMELIGPEPILECSFKNDTSKLENEIGKYLEQEDADRLITLLKTNSEQWYGDPENPENSENLENQINTEIKELLAKMCRNLDEKIKPSSEMIEKIYNDESDGRIYFNQSKDEYDKDFVLEPKIELLDKGVKIDEVDFSKIDKYKYEEYIKITPDEYKSLLDKNGQLSTDEYNTYNSRKNIRFLKEGVAKKGDWDDCRGDIRDSIFIYNGEQYTESDAMQKGLVDIYIDLVKKYEETDIINFNEEKIKEIFDSKRLNDFDLYYKDGTIGEVTFSRKNGIKVFRYKIEETTEPSIKKKFDFQIDRSLYKNKDEINDKNEIEKEER